MKFFSIFICFIFFSNFIFAHGPSRQKVIKKVELDANQAMTWEIVSNFSDFSWHPDLIKQNSSGNDIGSTRELVFKDNLNIKHSLEKLNSERKMISWRIIDSDKTIMPVNSYSATLTVSPHKEDQNKSMLVYKSAFYRGFMGNDPPEELNDENSKKKVMIFVDKAIEGLKNKVQQ